MTMNKVKGNMYNWVNFTWNPIRGKCPHNCNYCYMKSFWKIQNSTTQKLDWAALEDNLGSGNFIFVGSSTDMFADLVPDEWIRKVLTFCIKYSDNNYLLQTKNPQRMLWFYKHSWMGSNYIYGTTLETNRNMDDISDAPPVSERVKYLKRFKGRKMVSIEPILDFDLKEFIRMIRDIEPKFVSIGADSKGHNLPEPSWDKVQELIKELKNYTEVKIKTNLKRLKK